MPGDMFCNIDRIGSVLCPIYIIHGTRDEIVPCWHGQALYERCMEEGLTCKQFIVDGADHNNLEMHAGEDFQGRLQIFLQELRDNPVPQELQRWRELHGGRLVNRTPAGS